MVPGKAHYVDAVTVEDQTPWYEQKVDNKIERLPYLIMFCFRQVSSLLKHINYPLSMYYSILNCDLKAMIFSHGYICNDKNMPGTEKACQDMKVLGHWGK